MPDPTVAPVPEPSPIDHDLPCAICGYNLKGLTPHGNCPECGQAVARTFSAELARSDPAWLSAQARTMLPLAALGLANFEPFSVGRGPYLVWAILAITLIVIAAWACWRLATPEPHGLPDDRDGTVRRALRLSAVILALVNGSALVRAAFGPVVQVSASLVGVIALITTNALVGWLLLGLARRSQDRSLLLHARIVLWAFPLSQAGNLILPVIMAFTRRPGLGFAFWILGTLNVVTYLLGAAVYLVILLLGRMHEVLRAAAATSARAAADPMASSPP